MMETTKAIILAAGMGARLKPRTQKVHKCLTQINGKPILINALENLARVGVQETVLIIGYLGDQIAGLVGSTFQGMKICYVHNDDYMNTNTSLSLKMGLEYVQKYNRLYVIEGDVYFEQSVLNRIEKDKHPNTTLVEKFNERLDGTFVELDADGYVKDWTHKSMRSEKYVLYNKYKTVNIHRFSEDFVRNNLYPNALYLNTKNKGNDPLENVMRHIVRQNRKLIYGVRLKGEKWAEIDDEHDLKMAEEIFN